MALRLTCACGSYDRTKALQLGTIKPTDITLEYQAIPPEQIFLRQLRDHEFDVSEMSLSAYITAKQQDNFPYIALPIFPSRTFRHSAVYINRNSGIERPEQLRGRRVGVGFYQMTAAVWVRGMLKDEYGLDAKDIQWTTGQSAEAQGPSGSAVMQLQDMVTGTTKDRPPLEIMLENGKIDGLVSVHIPRSLSDGTGKIRRLFEDYQAVEEDYYSRTHVFPIMHTLVLRQSIYDTQPWVAANLQDAFTRAKETAEKELYDTNALAVMLPWLLRDIDHCRKVMGPDFWAYGLERNRKVLECFVRYLGEQDILSMPLDVKKLFAT